MIIVSAYGAGLTSTFTVPRYEASIDTVQDLVDRDMEWGATHDAWIFSLTLSKEVNTKKTRIYLEVNVLINTDWIYFISIYFSL